MKKKIILLTMVMVLFVVGCRTMVKIFGRPCWPFAPITLADTNPCFDAAIRWRDESPETRGYLWYYRYGIRRNEYYHAVGYTNDVYGNPKFIDCQDRSPINLTEKELSTKTLNIPPTPSR